MRPLSDGAAAIACQLARGITGCRGALATLDRRYQHPYKGGVLLNAASREMRNPHTCLLSHTSQRPEVQAAIR